MVVLEHLVQLPQVGPPLVMEVAVAEGGADNHTVLLHHPLVPDDLGGQGLHHLDGVGSHARAVVEVLGHPEHHHVILLPGVGHIGALVGHLPALGLHLGGIAGENGDLPGIGVQHRVAAEEGMAHLLLHPHPDLVELGAHKAVAGHGGEVLPVHHLGDVMAGDGPPVGNSGGAVLIASGVAAVGVPLGVSDEYGQVAVEHILVHQHRVAPAGDPQIHHVIVVLAVVGGDLSGVVELVEQLVPQDLLHLGHRGPGVQAVGEQQQDVLLLHPGPVQLVQAGPDGHLPVGSGLAPPLDDVGNDEHHRLARARQLLQRRRPDGVSEGV